MLEKEIAKGESNVMEFKRDIPKDSLKYVKTAVAFSNSRGGKIVFGVDDGRNIIGLNGNLYKIMDSLIDAIASLCYPQIFPDSYITTVSGKDLVVIDIKPGTRRPYHIVSQGMENGTYVRIMASTRISGSETLKDLMLEGERRSFDEQEYVGTKFEKDSEPVVRLCGYLSERTGKNIGTMDLINLGLLKGSEGKLIPSKAFMLLAPNPYPHARIQCARFKGNDRTEFIDRKEFGGSIIDQADNAVRFVLGHINYGARIKGMYRENAYEIPPEAIREVIVNAVIHRSYAAESSPVFVAVYDDRAEITSPGTMPFGLTAESAMAGRSKSRNPILARFFREAGLAEGWGSGIMRVMRACVSNGLKRPDIYDADEFVQFIIYRDAKKTKTERIDVPLMFETRRNLLTYFKKHPDADIDDVCKAMDISRSTANRSIKDLKEKGLLSREGSKKTGVWIVETQS